MLRRLPPALTSASASALGLGLLLACAACSDAVPHADEQRFALPAAPTLLAGGGDEVWMALGDGGAVWRWNGSALEPVDVGGCRARTMSATAPHDVWLGSSDANGADGPRGVRHWDGAVLSTSDPGEPIEALVASAADDVWAAGRAGLHRFDGSAWHDAPSPMAIGPGSGFAPVAASGRDDVWAYGWQGVLDGPQPQVQLAWFHFDGHDWARIGDGTGITDRLPGPFWSFPAAEKQPAELWAAATGSVSWRLHVPADCPRAVQGPDGEMVEMDDQSWCPLVVGGQVMAYAGRSQWDVYIVVRGSDGSQLLRFDGYQLRSVAVTPLLYDRLWVGANSVWATGTDAQKQAWAVRYAL